MLKNTILFGKICTTIIVIAFVVIPVLYAAQGQVNIISLFHRDIATVATPETQQYIPVQNGPPKPNMIWFEANAVRTIFEETLNNYQIDSLFGPAATTTNILKELNKGPKFVHFATHGKVEKDGSPALKAYNGYVHPIDIYFNVGQYRMSDSVVIILSACYSLYNYHIEDYDMNFGYVLVKWAEVPFVIGSRGVIDSGVLYWFTLDFYDFLFSSPNEGVADAYSKAYSKVKSDMENCIEWGIASFVFLLSVLTAGLPDVLLPATYKMLALILYTLFGWIITQYGEGALVDYLTEALTHLSNLAIYDTSCIRNSGGSGGGGGPYPPLIM